MTFLILITLLAVQRLSELVLARYNEDRLKAKGGLEFGSSHYPWIVLMHLGFFSSFIAEVNLFDKDVSVLWPFWLSIFLLVQIGRVWVITSLGPYWNTKIIVLPDAEVIVKGPYKYVKHPNYIIVATEILVISLLYNAYFTAALFTCLNAWAMSVRIPIEERALKNLTSYSAVFLKDKK
ncbi:MULTISPECIES: isoprenylcysteine carboxyl methyltransferase family protein [Bacillaceae]|uniref:Methyltransferase n=1 Tax=Peribacillus huizhouensis TaxID=1501239 RepID=A0ABR6CRV7_9BACI|nr:MULTISPECIES: isoprenylcysteine carboxylmethyltransferase family protein [Bacillaceae]MBA9027753.1 methyltransferase [Peribacillus huizhouensis]